MPFWSVVFKNLTRRPFRTALTLLAFATAISAVVSLHGVANGFTESFADVYESHSVDIVVSRQGSADRLSSSVDQTFSAKIQEIQGVSEAAGLLFETMSLEEEQVYGVPAMGIEEDSFLMKDYRILSSASKEQLDANATGRTMMLGINLAERAEKKAGDVVMLFEEPYLVSSVFESSSAWENGAMIMPLEHLQELTDRSGFVTYINVVLDKPVSAARATEAMQAIKGLNGRLHPLATEEFVETDTRMQLASAMAWMTSMIALVIGAIGILNTMLTSVLERTREIGILRAIGWPKKRVVWMILLESCALALVASVLGVLLAFAITWTLSQSSITQGVLTPAINGKIMLQGFVLALSIGVLGALIPAWRASKLMPTEAFRNQ